MRQLFLILDAPIQEYVSKITDEAKSKLFINEYSGTENDNVKEILRSRYKNLKGSIREHIVHLLT